VFRASAEAAKKRKGFWWSREDTLLLIFQCREHDEHFRNVNCQKRKRLGANNMNGRKSKLQSTT